ncbi:ORF4 [Wabat virus]|uniref:ORF4 n=1 Tax=Wabat virus TaxID=1888308 RepID=UPI00083EAD39|nr:ORF4 [Wabat virus]AOC55054.1 ORF4 [Wabat virus]
MFFANNDQSCMRTTQRRQSWRGDSKQIRSNLMLRGSNPSTSPKVSLGAQVSTTQLKPQRFKFQKMAFYIPPEFDYDEAKRERELFLCKNTFIQYCTMGHHAVYAYIPYVADRVDKEHIDPLRNFFPEMIQLIERSDMEVVRDTFKLKQGHMINILSKARSCMEKQLADNLRKIYVYLARDLLDQLQPWFVNRAMETFDEDHLRPTTVPPPYQEGGALPSYESISEVPQTRDSCTQIEAHDMQQWEDFLNPRDEILLGDHDGIWAHYEQQQGELWIDATPDFYPETPTRAIWENFRTVNNLRDAPPEYRDVLLFILTEQYHPELTLAQDYEHTDTDEIRSIARRCVMWHYRDCGFCMLGLVHCHCRANCNCNDRSCVWNWLEADINSYLTAPNGMFYELRSLVMYIEIMGAQEQNDNWDRWFDSYVGATVAGHSCFWSDAFEWTRRSMS